MRIDPSSKCQHLVTSLHCWPPNTLKTNRNEKKRLFTTALKFQSLLYGIVGVQMGYSLRLPFTALHGGKRTSACGCLFVMPALRQMPERGLSRYSFLLYIVPGCPYDLSNYREVRVENIQVCGATPKTMLAPTGIGRTGMKSHAYVVSSAFSM